MTLATTIRVVLPFAIGFVLSDALRVANAVVGIDLSAEFGLNPAELALLTGTFFIAFGLMQLPAGAALDRFGPRRVNAALMLIAALGAAAFALAETVWALTLARAILGAGVSVALMAGFQAFVLWFGEDRAPRFNSLLWAFGALGSLAATAPLRRAVDAVGWRVVFGGFAVWAVAVAVLLLVVLPERKVKQEHHESVGYTTIFRSRRFRAIAPVLMTTQAVYLSLPGLWAGPWLADVIGLDPLAQANALTAFPLGMLAGALVLAALVGRRGITAGGAADVGTCVFLLVQVALAVGGLGHPFLVGLAFGAFGVCGPLYYPVLVRAFPPAAAGRANTALNMVVFIVAFAAQYGMGGILGLWPAEGGVRPGAAYAASLAVVLVPQVLALAWRLAHRRD
ncbi:MAG: MFS transporter [Alphaproteobacteria bacterium]|nr:MFS transporter [Alphaproteobacteria bacterium]